MNKKTYSELLRDPRWQKKRLELMEAGGWSCRECGDHTATLNIHHGFYKRNTSPWEYPDDSMRVLCEPCHVKVQRLLESVHENISKFRTIQLLSLGHLLDADCSREHIARAFFILRQMLDHAGGVSNPPRTGRDFEWAATMAVGAAMKSAFDEAVEQMEVKDEPTA